MEISSPSLSLSLLQVASIIICYTYFLGKSTLYVGMTTFEIFLLFYERFEVAFDFSLRIESGMNS